MSSLQDEEDLCFPSALRSPSDTSSGQDASSASQLSTDRDAALIFQALFSECPVRLARFSFTGLSPAHRAIVSGRFQSMLERESSLTELSKDIADRVLLFERLELFKSARVTFRLMQETHRADAKGAPVPVEVEVDVKERRVRIHTGTEWQSNEVMMNAGINWYNVLGCPGLSMNTNMNWGSMHHTPFSISLNRYMGHDPDRPLTLALYSTLSSGLLGTAAAGAPSQGHHVASRGLSLSYAIPFRCWPRGHTTFSYEAVWRHLVPHSELASPSLRAHAGHTVKSSLKCIWSRGSRDDPILPTAGQYSRLSVELAGLGGTENFVKTCLSQSFHVRVPWTLCSSWFSFRGSYLRPLSTAAESSCFAQDRAVGGHYLDRSFVGGPYSVRGFKWHGFGPFDSAGALSSAQPVAAGEALGGSLSLESSLGINFPLVPKWQHVLRGQLYANAGCIATPSSLDSITVERLAQGFGASLGYGLAFKALNSARLEINMNFPIWAAWGMRTQPGLQFGLGLEFL